VRRRRGCGGRGGNGQWARGKGQGARGKGRGARGDRPVRGKQAHPLFVIPEISPKRDCPESSCLRAGRRAPGKNWRGRKGEGARGRVSAWARRHEVRRMGARELGGVGERAGKSSPTSNVQRNSGLEPRTFSSLFYSDRHRFVRDYENHVMVRRDITILIMTR